MSKKRVVITGMGIVGPLGNSSADFWDNIKKGTNGIDRITAFELEGHKVTMGAQVKDFEYPDKRAAKSLDLSSQYAITAAKEAEAQSGIKSGENVDPYRYGVYGSTGIGGICTLERENIKAHEKGYNRVSPHTITMTIPNMVSGNISIALAAKGSSWGLNSACATGTHTIGEAFRAISDGYLDAIMAGSSESPFAPGSFAGFENMKAMSPVSDRDRCCVPFDKERSGFIMGEGAAFFVMEEAEHALSRNASILCEVAGYGTTSDAYHITMPDPESAGVSKAMKLALESAGISPQDIDYINAHGTSTPYNDLYETKAIKNVFGEYAHKVPVSSTKSMTGHALGAAGSMEAFICAKAIEDSYIPPTINYKVPDEELDLDYVPNVGREAELKYVMSNSLGFGGHNAVLIFKKWENK